MSIDAKNTKGRTHRYQWVLVIPDPDDHGNVVYMLTSGGRTRYVVAPPGLGER